MRLIILSFLAILINTEVFAQQIDYNIQDGYIASGYDVTEYFNHKAIKGNKKISFEFENATYLFSSEKNKDKFKANPQKYIPQYGGWCAYAMGNAGKKVNVNPKTFEIKEGELYLFYNAYFNNTLDSWKKGDSKLLNEKADANWAELKYRS